MSLMMLLIAWVAGGTLSYSQAVTPADTSAYVWDAACKDCHSDIYEAWARTKHKTALNRLNQAEREQPCAACHLTGGATQVIADDKVLNTGVQCEACHGPGKEHVDTAKAGTPAKFAKKPGEATCVACHNDKSPHYNGFFYSAMKGFVHKTK